MGNENERKRNPARDRKERIGHKWDDAKTGGREQTVGQTNDRGFGKGGGPDSNSVGTVGVIGGSPDFLTDGEEATGQETAPDTSKGGETGKAESSDAAKARSE